MMAKLGKKGHVKSKRESKHIADNKLIWPVLEDYKRIKLLKNNLLDVPNTPVDSHILKIYDSFCNSEGIQFMERKNNMVYIHINSNFTEKYSLIGEIEREPSKVEVRIQRLSTEEEFELDKSLFKAYFYESAITGSK